MVSVIDITSTEARIDAVPYFRPCKSCKSRWESRCSALNGISREKVCSLYICARQREIVSRVCVRTRGLESRISSVPFARRVVDSPSRALFFSLEPLNPESTWPTEINEGQSQTRRHRTASKLYRINDTEIAERTSPLIGAVLAITRSTRILYHDYAPIFIISGWILQERSC